MADLRLLAALANPLDELAVYSVLASPLGGLSLDALALLGAARRLRPRPVVAASERRRGLDELLPAGDRRRPARPSSRASRPSAGRAAGARSRR